MDNNEIVREMSLLYELSLAIGTSPLLEENCKHFLTRLLSRKNYDGAVLWLYQKQLDRHHEGEDDLTPAFAFPEVRIPKASETYARKKMLMGDAMLKVCPLGEMENQPFAMPHDSKEGSYAFFCLGELGLMQVYAKGEGRLTALEMNKLRGVVEKFALSVQLCLDRLHYERELKERKLAEERQAASQKQLRLLFDSNPMPIMIHDLVDLKIVEVNQAMVDVYGYSREELLNLTVYELNTPEWATSLRRHVSIDGFLNREDIIFEKQHVTKEGKVIEVALISKAMHFEGQDTRVVILNDVTERKRAERSLLKSEAFTRKIIDTALDAVISIDAQGKITHWNKQAELTFGWTEEEVSGELLSAMIIPHAHRDAHEQGMKHYNATGEGPVLNQRIEITALRKGGEEFPVELTVVPIVTDDDAMFTAFIRDITESKETREALVKERERAETSMKMKERFLANMSHEIRTPMNVINGMVKLMINTGLPVKQKNYADAIKMSSDNLLVIINDILDFSKIESGKLSLERIGFNLDKLIASLRDAMLLKANEKGLELKYAVDEKITRACIGDPTRLNQVLLNLVSNALKFTEEGSVEIRAKLVLKQPDSMLIEFMVRDTGIGVEEENLGKIFQSFQQEDGSVTRKFGGTGLGLAITKQLVDLLGGNIYVKSKKGVGTAFYVVLSFDVGAPLADLQVEKESKVEDQNFSGLRVLIAEDNHVNQYYAIALLEETGVEFDVVDNGKEAVKMVSKNDYDVVLMDIQMPIMGGIEATKVIRATISSSIPIIALTANALNPDDDTYAVAGMDGYIAKPFDPQLLYNVLNKYAKHRRSGRPSETKSYPKVKELKSTSPAESHKLYNLNQLHKVSTRPDFLEKMISLFLEQTPPMVAELNACAASMDKEQLARVAHKLKASLDSMGIQSLYNTIREIEAIGKGEQGEGRLAELMELLNRTTDQVYAELKELL